MREKKLMDFIQTNDNMTRHEIVQKVVNTFINSEYSDRGKGIQFWYPVEELSGEIPLYIIRPGGLRGKWNFDFKVNIEQEFNMGKGTHAEVLTDFKNKKSEDPEKFTKLLQALTKVYECNNNVDKIIQNVPKLDACFKTGADVSTLLKVIKWMFVMEDIVYWNYKGRTMLYNHIMSA